MTTVRFQYIFDPLCGWCYAGVPSVMELAKRWPDQFELLPCGLFSERGARAITPEWATYAWNADQRIASLTGLDFSEAYHHNVLLNPTGRFDSNAINRALTETHSISPTLEPVLLKQLQIERYVAGRDTAETEVVAQVAATLLTTSGWEMDVATLKRRLEQDEALALRTHKRLLVAQRLMSQHGLQGVPQLLAIEGEKTHVIPSSALYQGADHLMAELKNTSLTL